MPNAYEAMNDAELKAAIADLEKQADDLRALDLKLDMARGKPSPQQTALSRPMLDLPSLCTPPRRGAARRRREERHRQRLLQPEPHA